MSEAYLPALFDKEYLGHKSREKVVFQQDGAKSHMSKGTAAWLSKELPRSFKCTDCTGPDGWPASSPDLNVIETLWAILQDRVIERRAYSYDELVNVITDEWWAIPQDVIRNLYHSIPTRIQKCLNADGGRFRI